MKTSSSRWLYLCLAPKVLQLCWRHNMTPASFVYANPLLPYGGLSFCEKHKIMEHFSSKAIPYVLLRRRDNERLRLACGFASRHSFPLVLKPNLAHAGIGVGLVQSMEALREALRKPTWDSLLQAYDDSPSEFSVFYSRLPTKPKGSVLSITEKIIPSLTGDGKNSLHQLLEASRYSNKKTLRKEMAGRESMVPSEGEEVAVGIVASHSRGGIFKDRSSSASPEFNQLIDELCNKKGFHFGRLDVKAESLDSLLKGQFSIIEVNGACAEFIQFWDERYTFKQLLSGYSKQFELLFKTSRESMAALKRSEKRLLNRPTLLGLAARYLSMFWLAASPKRRRPT